ncbi:MAG: hypothetical protein M0Z66_05875 [Thermaerobacter sp.]|nr:hypothetical protein [Thermaerobacter sp.]
MKSRLSVEYTFRFTENEYLILADAVSTALQVGDGEGAETAEVLHDFLQYLGAEETADEEPSRAAEPEEPAPRRVGLLGRFRGE